MTKLLWFVLVLINTSLFAQTGKVGIGAALPTDKLHINSAAEEDALRVQVNNSTKLRVWANGGTSIGNIIPPPVNGLLVQGAIQPQNNISTANKLIIESTSDSLIITAGSSQVVIASNGNIIIQSGGTSKIDIVAGGNLNLSGTNISIQATANLNLNGSVIRFNGGTRPIARQGDAVSVSTSSGLGNIVSGSTSIFSN